VDICAPNAAHRDIALDAIEHGKHVICEKPLALDVDGARRMWAAASRAQILTQVCFYYRLWPTLSTIKDVVDAGAIGTLQHFKGHMLQDYAASPRTDLGWRAQSSQAGAGAITDLGSHIIDVARYLCGDISHVTALTRGLVERPHASTDVDDLAALLVRFANGATGTIEASWALRGHRCDLAFDLVGDRGAVRFAWERANEFELLTGDMGDPNNGFRRVLLGAEHGDAGRFIGVPAQGMGYRDAFTIGVGTFVSAFARGEKQVEPTFDAGVAVASVVDAALRSAAVGEWVEVRRVT
jgi:predicted dehydrogenase